jgi:hypothetical protein
MTAYYTSNEYGVFHFVIEQPDMQNRAAHTVAVIDILQCYNVTMLHSARAGFKLS